MAKTTIVLTDTFGEGWTKQNDMNTEIYTDKHVANTDTSLDLGGTNPVTAAEIVKQMNFHNGTFQESMNCVASSDGTTIIASLQSKAAGDLTMRFSDGFSTLDCTPAAEVTLTAGSATIPQSNYVYVLQSTKALTVSTTGWPITEHIKVSYFLVTTPAYVQSEGALINQNWNDELADFTNNMGHLTHMGEWIRSQGATWFSGCDGGGTSGYLTIGAGTCTVQVNSGVISQMHKHLYTAHDTATGSDIHVINDETTPYAEITDLTSIITDTLGATLNNKYYNLVLAGVANKSGSYSPLFILKPTGSYNSEADAINDVDNTAQYNLPREFTKESSTGFLIARIVVRLSGGNITLSDTIDLRGQNAATAGGGAGLTTTEFSDTQFRIFDTDASTSELAFDLSGITPGNTRTITMPDTNVDLGAPVVADNAITLAKMAHGTDGNLITYDADGAPAYVDTGTATHVLTSNGAGAAPTFQATALAGALFRTLAVADLADTTAPSVLTIAETTNTLISNYKTTGADHGFSMPAAHAAGNVIFVIGDEFQVGILPNTGDFFYLNGVAMAADKLIQNTAGTLGETITGVVANINGTLRWMFYSSFANFVEETP